MENRYIRLSQKLPITVPPYEHTERQVVYSVVSSAESKKVRKAVKEADPNAFINVVKTERLFGHFYYKPND